VTWDGRERRQTPRSGPSPVDVDEDGWPRGCVPLFGVVFLAVVFLALAVTARPPLWWLVGLCAAALAVVVVLAARLLLRAYPRGGGQDGG
jgi:hypothetical protein